MLRYIYINSRWLLSVTNLCNHFHVIFLSNPRGLNLSLARPLFLKWVLGSIILVFNKQMVKPAGIPVSFVISVSAMLSYNEGISEHQFI